MHKHVTPIYTRTGWYRIWYEICSEYSSRNITAEADRIPAMHGLASYFSDVLHDIPVLGLWEKNFIESLCWRKDLHPPKRKCEWKVPQNIPSWSWFSSGVNVLYDYYGIGLSMSQHSMDSGSRVFDPTAEFMSVHVEWTGAPVFSSIASTKLVLRSRMVLINGAHYEELIEHQKPADQGYPRFAKFSKSLDARLENVPPHVWAFELGVLRDCDPIGTAFLYLAKSNEQPDKFCRLGIGYHTRFGQNKDEDIFSTSSPQIISLL
jgi:hypothetical protein